MYLRPRLIWPTVAALALVSLVPGGPADAVGETCFDQPATIVATADGQTITGTEGSDVISAAGFGNVRIDALAGDDLICNDGSASSIFLPRSAIDGGLGDDRLSVGSQVAGHGGPGGDLLVATEQSQLYGDDGNDTLRLESGPTVGVAAHGGSGDDVLTAGSGVSLSLLAGGDGNDQVTSSGGLLQVDPGAGDDVVSGNDRTILDYVEPAPLRFRVAAGTVDGQGHDTFTGISWFSGGAGADTFIGSNGADRYRVGDYWADGMEKDLPRRELGAANRSAAAWPRCVATSWSVAPGPTPWSWAGCAGRPGSTSRPAPCVPGTCGGT